jgi:hypothetical protein
MLESYRLGLVRKDLPVKYDELPKVKNLYTLSEQGI